MKARRLTVSEWYSETYDDRIKYGLRVSAWVHRSESPYQRIEVFDSVQWGRVLALDGVLQTSAADEAYYHEMLVHPAALSCRPGRVLIVGGGDGGTAREVLRHDDVESVDLVEIDEAVVRVCQEFLPELGNWNDPRLHLHFEDGGEFVRRAASASYDLVLVDGTDPVGPGAELFGPRFVAQAARILSPAGRYAQQTGSAILQRDDFLRAQRDLRAHFESVRPFFGPVPLYAAGQWSWTLAGHAPPTVDEARAAKIAMQSQIYNPELHGAAFAQPTWLRRLNAAPLSRAGGASGRNSQRN